MVAEKNIQMQHNNNGTWDKLYPLSKYENISDNSGNTLDIFVSNTNEKLENITIHVKNFGVVGDGIADDTVAFQNIFNMASDTQGIELIVPAGTYRVTSEWVIRSNTKMVCHPNAIFRKESNRNFMNFPRDVITTGYDGYENIYISGGVWDCLAPNYGGGTPFPFIHAKNLTFKNMIIKNCNNGHAFEINACKDVIIDNCKFLGFYGADTYSEAIQLDLAKSSGAAPWYDGAFDNTPCTNIFVERCYFGASEINGSWGRGVGSHSSTVGFPHTNVFVNNNHFEDTLQWGVRAYNWERFSVTNNKFTRCGMGINVRTPITGIDTENGSGVQVDSPYNEGGVIQGNVIYGGLQSGRGIEIYGEVGSSQGRPRAIQVIGNTINPGGSHTTDAICFNYTEMCSCVGNWINTSGANGIVIKDNTTNMVVNGNTMEFCEAQGISVYGNSNYISIEGNAISRVQESCISVTDCEGITATGNVLVGANGVGGVNSNSPITFDGSCNMCIASGNMCRNYGSSHVADNGLYASTETTNISFVANQCSNFTKIFNGSTGAGQYDAQLNLINL